MLASLAKTRRNFGSPAAIRWFGARVLEKVLWVESSELLLLNAELQAPPMETLAGFSFQFLPASEVAEFSTNARGNLSSEFIANAASRGEMCVAVLKENQIVSYSWYALHSIEGENHVGVPMSYSADFAYLYNAYTRPEFRGHRLFGSGISVALRALTAQNITKLIATVNGSNYSSLKSLRQAGFSRLGRIWTFGHGAKRFAITPSAAGELGIRFGR
jgi:hypothetical protein